MLPDALVKGLAVAPLGRCGHQDTLGRHVWQRLSDTDPNYFRVHNQPAGDIDGQLEYGVRTEECLGQSQTTVRAVVKRPLQPLSRGRLSCARNQGTNEASDATHSFRAHRVPLVGHGRRADLFRLEGLLQLLPMSQEPNVGAEFVGGLADTGKDIQYLAINLASVRLACNRVDGIETHFPRHQEIQLADLVVVASEKRQEASLRAG